MIDLLIFVIIGAVIVFFVLRGAKKKKEVEERLGSEFSDLHVSRLDRSRIGVNFDRGTVVLGFGDTEKEFPFSDLVSVDFLEESLGPNGEELSGPVGSLNNRVRVRKLELVVGVRDKARPSYSIDFMHGHNWNGFPATDIRVTDGVQLGKRYEADIKRAMRRFETSVAAPAVTAPAAQATPNSQAQELEKLWGLKQSGALTQEEYDDQKRKILARG